MFGMTDFDFVEIGDMPKEVALPISIIYMTGSMTLQSEKRCTLSSDILLELFKIEILPKPLSFDRLKYRSHGHGVRKFYEKIWSNCFTF